MFVTIVLKKSFAGTYEYTSVDRVYGDHSTAAQYVNEMNKKRNSPYQPEYEIDERHLVL